MCVIIMASTLCVIQSAHSDNWDPLIVRSVPLPLEEHFIVLWCFPSCLYYVKKDPISYCMIKLLCSAEIKKTIASKEYKTE